MAADIVIRSKWDRIRYTIIFEILLIGTITPALSYFLDKELLEMGALSLILSLKAMIINLIFNYAYDRVDVAFGRIPTERSIIGRIVHALSFELTLTATSLPIIMWWLGFSLWQALVMDIAVMASVVLMTFAYTWIYDRFFPVIQKEAIA
ncbi:PACE efflux transporter [Aliamphritea ceti]|uniref:PACE efflux transporter n=1 Tax=Aliamphritea ceti TaxID=1524258 RepID=UPI0021C33988|nr:PACE efflux transporter [Aliamphritea ceti]